MKEYEEYEEYSGEKLSEGDYKEIENEIFKKYEIDIKKLRELVKNNSKFKFNEETMNKMFEDFGKLYYKGKIEDNISLKNKFIWACEYAYFGKLYGEKYGFFLSNPYSEKEIINFEKKLSKESGEEIILPNNLRDHLLNVSREIFIYSYPIMFDLDVRKNTKLIYELKHDNYVYDYDKGIWFECNFLQKLLRKKGETRPPDDYHNYMFYVGEGGCEFEKYMTLNGDVYDTSSGNFSKTDSTIF